MQMPGARTFESSTRQPPPLQLHVFCSVDLGLGDSFRTNLRHYPIATTFLPQLEGLNEEYQLRQVEYWKDEMTIYADNLETTLVNEVVILTFYIDYTEAGMVTIIHSIEVM